MMNLRVAKRLSDEYEKARQSGLFWVTRPLVHHRHRLGSSCDSGQNQALLHIHHYCKVVSRGRRMSRTHATYLSNYRKCFPGCNLQCRSGSRRILRRQSPRKLGMVL